MFKPLKTALLAAGIVFGCAGFTQAAVPADLHAFNLQGADGWADRLVLCDVTAFLAAKPDLNANRMWVRRQDGHSDLLLPPDFVTGGQWYKEDYQRLYFKLKGRKKIDSAALRRARVDLGRPFVEAYRRGVRTVAESRFLLRQDQACRTMAREEGVIVS